MKKDPFSNAGQIIRRIDPAAPYLPNGLPKVYHMPTIATKLSADLAHRVQRMAASRKTTVSSLVRKAGERVVSGRSGETFGRRFGHLFG
ncbi:MAG: hypothetical protein WAN79_05290, partial [Opitutaceae bacterium]